MIIENLFANVLSMSTIASIVFLMTMLIRKIIKNKISSSKLCLLWIIFICTLIFPLRFSSPLSIKNFINHSKNSVIINFTNSYDLNNASADVVVKHNLYNDYIPVMWITISALLLLKDALIHISISKSIRKNDYTVPQNAVRLLEKCKKEMKISDKITCIIQEKIKTPSLFGIFRTKILLSKEILELPDDELKFIFIHELSHYKNNHQLLYIVLNILKNIYWFNPVIYVANRLIKQDLEYIADENVLKITNNRKNYSITILKILALNNKINYSFPNICGEKIEVERRLRKMKEIKIDTKWSIVIIATIIVAMSLITISLATDRKNENTVNTENVEIGKKQQKQEDTVKELIQPLKDASVSYKFGKIANKSTDLATTHTGIDLIPTSTDEIVAIADGKVIYADYSSGSGNTVKIEHVDGSVSMYAHGSKILVSVGDEIKAGDTIMIVGSTGMATGKHLHFELTNADGEYVDVNQFYE